MHKLHTTIQTEVEEPIKGTVTGIIPAWIEGSLYRNGPGMFEFGEHKYNHFFDGMAMVQRFHIEQARYQERKKLVEDKEDIVAKFFRFLRFLTRFVPMKLTDNTLVNVFPFKEDLYATTETNFINKVHPNTLEILEQVDLQNAPGLFLTAAHPHWEADGTVHYIGLNFSGGIKTHLVSFKPGQDAHDFPKATPVCTLVSPWKIHSPYYHSFAVTDNYFILIQQSLVYGVLKIALKIATAEEALTWYPDTPTRFHIIDKKTGKAVNGHVTYETEAMFVFHHINAYEDNGHVVMDVCCHKDKKIIEYFYMKNVASADWQAKFRQAGRPIARRYVIPLNIDAENGTCGNAVTLEDTTATCTKKDDNVFHCTYEVLADVGMELPTISYDRYNGKQYRYIYGTKFDGRDDTPFSILKIDTATKTYKEWVHPRYYPSEPIFIPRPDGHSEDDGVVVVAVNRSDWEEGHNPFLVILDGNTLEEIGRAEITGVERFPHSIHGIYRSANQK